MASRKKILITLQVLSIPEPVSDRSMGSSVQKLSWVTPMQETLSGCLLIRLHLILIFAVLPAEKYGSTISPPKGISQKLHSGLNIQMTTLSIRLNGLLINLSGKLMIPRFILKLPMFHRNQCMYFWQADSINRLME